MRFIPIACAVIVIVIAIAGCWFDLSYVRRAAKLKRKIAYHRKAIQLIAQGRSAEVPPLGTHEDEL